MYTVPSLGHKAIIADAGIEPTATEVMSLVCNHYTYPQEWCLRRESNPQITDSKSAAFTNFATEAKASDGLEPPTNPSKRDALPTELRSH
jgi:hypothetical protein